MDVPRYKLVKGQHLVYESSSRFTYETGSFDDSSRWDAWVTADDVDGVRLLLLHSVDDSRGPINRRLCSGTLTADGRMRMDSASPPDSSLPTLFPILPGSEDELHAGWSSRPDPYGAFWWYQSEPDDSSIGPFNFCGIFSDPLAKIYLSQQTAIIHFDTVRGLMDHAVIQSSQEWGLQGKGTTTVRLQSVEIVDRASLSNVTADASIVLAALETYVQRMLAAEKDPEPAGQMDAALRCLEAALDRISEPAFRALLGRHVARHPHRIEQMKEDAAHRAALLNQPCPDFSAIDYDGRNHSLSDYRGKVVVLDLWYRGCGWCIRTMPQVQQLASDFAGQPVAVLGLCTDRNEDDARFVIREMALTYPTLKALDVPEVFLVHGFPTLILIDSQGIVRDLHVGWSADLRKEIGRKIRNLLSLNGDS